MKKSIIIMALLFLGIAAAAQSYGEIQGKISDNAGEPVMFATVKVEQGSKVSYANTDEEGRFKIKPLNSGSATVFVSNIGFQSLQVQDVLIKNDQITFLNDLVLSPSVVTIGGGEGVKIIHRTIPLINPEETGLIAAEMDDFKHSPTAKNLQGVVTTLAPAVSPAADGSGLTFKGSRTGANLYYIDGVKLMGTIIPSLPSSGIKTISVYTGGVPAKYGDCTGGVVVIETKDYFSEYNKRKYSN